jgi:DNA-binding PucR family transcriptional regulator
MVHPNTVSYRVHQAEEFLGRPVDINTLDLSVALALLPAIRGLTLRSGVEL